MIVNADRQGLARSGLISLVGSAFAAGMAFVLTALVGRGLGADGTGLFFQAVGLFTIAAQVLRLGANTGLIRSLAAQGARGDRGQVGKTLAVAVVPVVVVSTLVSALVSANAYELAQWLAAPEAERDLAILLERLAPFVVVAAVLGVLLSGIRMLRGVAAFTVIQNILLPIARVGLVAAAVSAGLGAISATMAWAASLPLWLALSAALLVRPIMRDIRDAVSHVTESITIRQFWAFSAFRGVGAILEIVLEWVDVLIVAALRSPAEAGLYAVATRAVRAGQVVDRSMRVAVSPRISALLAAGEAGAARALHTTVARAMVLATWPYYVTLAFFGPAILQVFGSEFVEGSIVLTVLAGSVMIAAAAGMLQSILLMGGRSNWQVLNKSLAVALSVVLNLTLVPRFGILGAAITWAVVVLVDTSVAAWQVHYRLGVLLEPRALLGPAALTLSVFGGVAIVARHFLGASVTSLVVYAGISGSIYAWLCWSQRDRLGIGPLWDALLKRQ